MSWSRSIGSLINAGIRASVRASKRAAKAQAEQREKEIAEEISKDKDFLLCKNSGERRLILEKKFQEVIDSNMSSNKIIRRAKAIISLKRKSLKRV